MGALVDQALAIVEELKKWQGRPLTFMEVCGTHTMAAARTGLRSLLPANVRLISGPGCPVCVTPVAYIDHALAIAVLPNVIVTTFGDLMRVPGSHRKGETSPPSLQYVKASGGDVRVVYSALDALDLARREPDKHIVFLGVGFETTVPTLAATIVQAKRDGVTNFSMLCATKTIPEAMELLATSPDLNIDGFLCPGHVSVVLGPEIYIPIAQKHRLACAIAGFEPIEILRGLQSLVEQVKTESPRVDNCYAGAVRSGGNPRARAVVDEVFEACDATWRGLGSIAHSGLKLRASYAAFDASLLFDVEVAEPIEPKGCRCGDVLKGILDPASCPLFGKTCSPESPQGACMVSSEGSCAARYHFSDGEWQ